jgi:hypothetical protein
MDVLLSSDRPAMKAQVAVHLRAIVLGCLLVGAPWTEAAPNYLKQLIGVFIACFAVKRKPTERSIPTEPRGGGR